MRSFIGLAALLLAIGIGALLVMSEVGADGRCGELHGEAPAHPGHRDGDGDGLICEGHEDPAGTPAAYDREDWGFDSSAARALLGCDDSEHVDHVVALKEAHDSGGANWSTERKHTFANDIANLRCLDAETNLAKSDHDLAEWSGGSCDLRKEIAISTALVKAVYGLSTDPAEEQAIAAAIDADCTSVQASTAEIEVRVAARRLADGRVEFAVQYRVNGGEWSDRILPRARRLPTMSAVDRWLASSPVTLP